MTACMTPTPFETLVALWAGELSEAEATAVEDHAFACDQCAAAYVRLAALLEGVGGLIPPVVSRARRDQLVAGGMRIRHTPVEAGVTAEATFGADVDLLVHVLRADLTGAERVDVECLDPEGVARLHFEHVPFDVATGQVLVACQRHFQHLPLQNPVMRLHVVQGGVRRPVGDYLVIHHWPDVSV